MPNTKKDHTDKCGSIMVPVKEVPTFMRYQKRPIKIARHKQATKYVIVPLQKRINLFVPTNACNYICFSIE